MPRRSIWVVLVVLGGSTFAWGEDQVARIDLGGLRQASATIRVTEQAYVIEARMLPVSCFDATTNQSLNREKARAIALQGLAKYLSSKATAEVTVSGAHVESTALAGNVYTLTLRIPRGDVHVVGRNDEPPAKPERPNRVERIVFSSALFTRKSDYRDTLDQLARRTDEALKESAKLTGDAFYDRIVTLEAEGLDNLRHLAAEVDEDSLLLSVEKEELTRLIDERRRELLKELKDAVAQFEARKEEAA